MVDIVFVLDESSSMNTFKSSYIKGINSLINTQKSFNPDSYFTMVKFSTRIKTLCLDIKISLLPEFTDNDYEPNGVTSLYDAIGHAMKLKYNNKCKSVIMFILTDGEDNNSSEFTTEKIKAQVNYLSHRGWNFVYIAAHKNVKTVGENLGIHNCVSYNETEKSISDVVDACNIAIGHSIANFRGVPNVFSEKKIPNDVRDLLDGFSTMKI